MLFSFVLITTIACTCWAQSFNSQWMKEALVRVCKEQQVLLCKRIGVDRIKRVEDALAGWIVSKKGNQLAPVLSGLAKELLKQTTFEVKGEEKKLIQNLIFLLIEGDEFAAAGDLVVAFHKRAGLKMTEFIQRVDSRKEFVISLGKRYPDFVKALSVSGEVGRPALVEAVYNEATTAALTEELWRTPESPYTFNKFASPDRCIDIEPRDDLAEHLKNIKRVLKEFSQMMIKGKAVDIAEKAELCYGDSLQAAQRIVEANPKLASMALWSNSFEISVFFAKKAMSTDLAAFFDSVDDLKAVWPFFRLALVNFCKPYYSAQVQFPADKNLFLASLIQAILNSGRAKDFVGVLLAAFKEINVSRPGDNFLQYTIRLSQVEGFRTLMKSTELMDALFRTMKMTFYLPATIFAAVLIEDPKGFKEELTRFRRMRTFFDHLFLLKGESRIFTVPAEKDEFVALLDVVLLKNEFMDARAYSLQQLKRLASEFKQSTAFIEANSGWIAFIRYWWGEGAVAELPEEIVKLLPEYGL